jgi:hypothetical protein
MAADRRRNVPLQVLLGLVLGMLLELVTDLRVDWLALTQGSEVRLFAELCG